jgi:anaerobic magnesium-protoporphyrin IX monomethyl ester cyclase
MAGMDILLTHGYFLHEDEHEKQVMRPYPPLGLLYVSAHLKEQGFDVAVYDTTFSTPADFQDYIQRERPPVVGIYGNMMTRRQVISMTKSCRSQGCIVIVGGPDPANYAEQYLEHGADVVVIGEGEITLSELLPHLAQYGPRNMAHINGIAYREDETRFVRTEARAYLDDLDAQPFPDRAAINIDEYVRVWRENHGQGAVSLITARGCPYKCNWCSHAVFGYTHRRRSPANVADEVALIRERYRPDLLWYADDVFTINHRWLFAYAAELHRRGLNMPFETISREDRLNEEVIETLAAMGCYRLWVGAESGSQRILDAMQRQTDVKRVTEMVRLLKHYGIQTGMFIMLGYEGEEIGDLEATVQTLKDASPDIFLTTVAYPIAGTGYYEKVAGRVISRRAWAESSDSDHTVAGRHSRRYYRHATRWMVGEVDYYRQRLNGSPDYVRAAKAFVNAKLGRLGMMLSQHEVERGG